MSLLAAKEIMGTLASATTGIIPREAGVVVVPTTATTPSSTRRLVLRTAWVVSERRPG